MDLEKVKRGEIKNLEGANLKGVDLSGVYLTGANLRYANLEGADLTGANLREADLRYANLTNTDLIGTYLRNADLKGADLRGSDLSGSDLRNADLRNSYLKDIKVNYMTEGYNIACPEEGSFIGYKKANGCLIKLLILEDSKRSSATTIKCRCDKAKVLDIINIKTGEKISSVASGYDEDFIYTVEEIVRVNNFDNDRWNEYTTGIHFFMNKENAINF